MMFAAGFTLLEMLVVVALLGALAATAPMASKSLSDRARLDYGVRATISRISAAESLTRVTGLPVRLSAQQLAAAANTGIWAQSGITGAPLPNLRFFPDGSATPAIICIWRGSRNQRLILDGLIGIVRVTGH